MIVALDDELLQQLLDGREERYSFMVMNIAMANMFGGHPSHGQDMIARAIRFIDHLLDAIEEHPEIENPDQGVLGGLLTRTTLLRMRAIFHMRMADHKKAIKYLNKALKIDENYTAARELRIDMWATYALKDEATILAEYTRILQEVHEDDQRNVESYAWLAVIIMNNATLGTMDDAKLYYEKCIRSQMRRAELYGQHTKANEPEVLQLARANYTSLQNPKLVIFHRRRELDAVRKAEQTKNKNNNNIHACLHQVLQNYSRYGRQSHEMR